MAQTAHASSNPPWTGPSSPATGVDGIRGRPPIVESCTAQNSAGGCARCDVRHLALCAALNADDLPHLEATVSTVSLGPGRPLFREGDPVRCFYSVAAGTLRLFKLLPDGRRQITGFGLAGDFVGLSTGGAHLHGAEAVDRVEVCRFPVRSLHELFARFPEMEHRLLEMRVMELVAAQNRMLLLGRKNPLEKVASFLMEASDRQVDRGWPASPVTLVMTRADIADYLGLTVETVSRCFTRLRRDGFIALPEPTSVALLDRERLQDLGAGE